MKQQALSLSHTHTHAHTHAKPARICATFSHGGCVADHVPGPVGGGWVGWPCRTTCGPFPPPSPRQSCFAGPPASADLHIPAVPFNPLRAQLHGQSKDTDGGRGRAATSPLLVLRAHVLTQLASSLTDDCRTAKRFCAFCSFFSDVGVEERRWWGNPGREGGGDGDRQDRQGVALAMPAGRGWGGGEQGGTLPLHAMWQGQGREEGALGILCFFSAHRNCTPDFGCPFWLLRAAGDLANRGVGGEAVNPNATE